jgi:hypothetical protein
MDQMLGHIFCRERSPERAPKLPAKVFSRLFCLPAKTLPAKLFAGCFLLAGSLPALVALFVPAVLCFSRQIE